MRKTSGGSAGDETEEKARILSMSERYVCPNRVRFLRDAGIELVMGRREAYRFWDLDGAEFIDLHINGGVFSLGHRNPDIVAALVAGAQTLDIGNHHFPSVHRAHLAQRLVELTPGSRYAVFASGGGEAVDLAIKSARRATGRRRIVSVVDAYHGHTGLALAAGDERSAAAFRATGPSEEFVHVPFNELDAMRAVIAEGDVAAVLLETIPATAGFPVPAADYLPGVRAMCDEHGTAFIADEVQTGLGRTGPLWAVERFGVVPDILVTGKGLSGGMYPIAATLLSERMGQWLEDDGWSHVSTFGGSELGCHVAQTVLEITTDPATRRRATDASRRWAQGLAALHDRFPEWLVEIRQTGLVIGVRFGHEAGGMLMTRLLYDSGVWAMFAGFDRSVLQVKPGLLMDDETTDQALDAFGRACATGAAM
ncbi:MAG: aminotransferase class III-fold pyridoxal phosphate-dependent enzyme [Pseudomonadota bacterium]|nr:aminotransferase class III-fold pyridoxal phosphate-dependent enzyme [Pseudomonadota bacterium]